MPDAPAPGASACPTCQGELAPRLLQCRDCGTRVELPGHGNEFAELDTEMLHILRIFVLCEGRIRDMEAALGVSYPTVKARLSKLREALGLAGGTESASTDRPEATASSDEADSTATILAQLERGAIAYEEALARIRALR